MVLKLEPVSLTEFLVAFLICLICFLIGYFFARWYYKKRCEGQLKALKEDFANRRSATKENSTVKAVKTRERTGEAVAEAPLLKGVKASTPGKPQLNFGSIGVADKSEKDDLKKISGVGPFIEKKLNDIGIYTFKQISRFTDHDIETVTKLIEFFPGRIKRDDWKKQATTLSKGGETNFSKRVDNKDVDYGKK